MNGRIAHFIISKKNKNVPSAQRSLIWGHREIMERGKMKNKEEAKNCKQFKKPQKS